MRRSLVLGVRLGRGEVESEESNSLATPSNSKNHSFEGLRWLLLLATLQTYQVIVGRSVLLRPNEGRRHQMRRKAMLVLVAISAALVVGSGVALAATFTCTTDPCVGTPDPDVITGTPDPEEIQALEGNDLVDANAGDDTVYGGPDGDGSAQGTARDDLNLEGAGGSDTVLGQGGDDVIDADTNDTSGSFDRSVGGANDDLIYAVDGNEDSVNCGAGRGDVARIDKRIDSAKECETVRRL